MSLRNYGEFTNRDRAGHWVASKAVLERSNCDAFPGWDLDIRDQVRVDAWLVEFARFVAADSMPALTLLRLPNDHTAGATAGEPTPRAYMADNDLALGRVIEALSKSPFWKDTVVFVLEDDAQDGPDHVDSHRSPLLVISAWNKPGVVHRFANTTDVLATIGAILKLAPMSQFDAFGWPIDGDLRDRARSLALRGSHAGGVARREESAQDARRQGHGRARPAPRGPAQRGPLQPHPVGHDQGARTAVSGRGARRSQRPRLARSLAAAPPARPATSKCDWAFLRRWLGREFAD